jgi:hypothetical protein
MNQHQLIQKIESLDDIPLVGQLRHRREGVQVTEACQNFGGVGQPLKQRQVCSL